MAKLLNSGKILPSNNIGGVLMGLDKIAEYKKKLGLTTEELSRRSGVPVGTLNKILSGETKDPKLETLKAIARVLGLTLNDFDDNTYYTNEQTAAVAQELLENPDMRVLFDAAKDSTSKDLQMAADLLKRFKSTNPDG